MQTYDEFQV